MNWQASGKRLREYLAVTGEALRARPLQAPATAAKLAAGRLFYDIGPADFLMFDLADRPLSTWKNYLREDPHNARLLRILHPRPAMVAKDKLLSAERAVEHGIAIAPILAVVCRDRAEFPCAGRFAMLDDRAAVLAAMPAWPDRLFIKPVGASYGRGAMAASRANDDGRGGWHNGDRRLSADEFADVLLGYDDPMGVLVQPRITNDPAMAPVGGDYGLAATRIITALTDSGPEILLTMPKLFGRPALADNFAAGFSGHLVGVADPATGRLRVAYGRQPGHRHLLTRFTHHPGTGAPLDGFRFPHWAATIEQATALALAFPELPLLGHDIAITGQGPMFLETNTYWKVSLPQLALGGLRPTLERLIPRLHAPEEAKRAALAAIAPGRVRAPAGWVRPGG